MNIASTLLVNRTTIHIDFGTISATAGAYTMNRCGSITRGNLATLKKFTTLADLKAYLDGYTGRKVCKTCLKALDAVVAEELAYQERLAASLMPATEAHDLGHVDPTAAPVVSAVVLPEGVWMEQDGSRILRGKVGHMLALMDSGLAVLTDDGDLVLR